MRCEGPKILAGGGGGKMRPSKDDGGNCDGGNGADGSPGIKGGADLKSRRKGFKGFTEKAAAG